MGSMAESILWIMQDLYHQLNLSTLTYLLNLVRLLLGFT